ncbi:MAG: hypothetical protein WA081_04315 [Desulfosalsimonadaceae bacterium]
MATEKSRQAEREEKRRFWKQHIEGWRVSDRTRADYCRRHDLLYHRFVYWKRKFQPVSKPAFVEVKLSPGLCPKMLEPASFLRVSVSRFQIAVDPGFDPEVLGRLVYTLEQL